MCLNVSSVALQILVWKRERDQTFAEIPEKDWKPELKGLGEERCGCRWIWAYRWEEGS